jgi:hypothetical protein
MPETKKECTCPDLTAEEYNAAMDAMMAVAASIPVSQLAAYLTLVDSIKNKFGASARRRRGE